ncbi:hypothetical protein IT575_05145 [bacterium]|nr:hypothetical protein [bacterium]
MLKHDKQAAESVAGKLQSLHATLDKPEQQILEDLLKTFVALSDATINQPDFAESAKDLDEVNALLDEARSRVDLDDPLAATTITITTITTTIASHPRIGC